jgi:hypothetical protein
MRKRRKTSADTPEGFMEAVHELAEIGGEVPARQLAAELLAAYRAEGLSPEEGREELSAVIETLAAAKLRIQFELAKLGETTKDEPPDAVPS